MAKHLIIALRGKDHSEEESYRKVSWEFVPDSNVPTYSMYQLIIFVQNTK